MSLDEVVVGIIFLFIDLTYVFCVYSLLESFLSLINFLI